MKKTYQNPVIKVVEIHTAQMLAASVGYGGSTSETSGNLSRRFSGDVLDDEEY
jgi:hypothetical protein